MMKQANSYYSISSKAQKYKYLLCLCQKDTKIKRNPFFGDWGNKMNEVYD